MAYNFPNSPSNGDTVTVNNVTYTYNSTSGAWKTTATSGGGGASVTVSETAPASPTEGDLWFDPSVLKTFVYYNDGTANQWVQSNPTGSGGGASGGASVTVSETAPTSPSAGDLWWSSSEAVMYIYYTDSDSSQWVSTSTPGADGAAGADGASATGYGQLPIVYTEPATTHDLNNDGSSSTVQMQAVDPEGTAITYAIAYANSTNALPAQLASATTIDQSTGTYTFNPTTTTSNAGSFKARLSASDGITSATRFVNFSLGFTHTLHYLVIAGGGGGGGSNSGFAAGGGGGAGGYRSSWNNESSGGGAAAESAITGSPGDVYTITVGAGGTGAVGNGTGTNGGNSSIAKTGMTTISSVGGGYGGSSAGVSPASGGSGGGAAPYDNTLANGTANQGYNGGLAYGSGGDYSGGGGGGAGAVGASASAGSEGADGGVGVASTITGSSVYRAGGGGGGDWNGPNGGTGGNGGGGDANQSAGSNGVDGTANTGGGGGGGGATSSYVADGGDGGSGVVIIRSSTQAASTTGSPVETTDGSDYIYQFNADGTITF